MGGPVGCERRIRSFCENSKKKGGCRGVGLGWSGSWGVRVDVNENTLYVLKKEKEKKSKKKKKK